MNRKRFLKSFILAASVMSLTVLPTYLPAYCADENQAQAESSYLTKEQFTEYNLWTNYINDYPNDSFGYINRANIQYFAQNYKKALDDYDLAIGIEQYNADAYLKRGNCYFMLKDNAKALLDYSSALQINPQIGEAYFNMGRIYYEENDLENAINNMKQGISYSDEREDYFYELGRAQYRAGKFEEAYNNFNSALSINPESIDALYARGLTALNLNNNDIALESFNKVSELNSDYQNVSAYKGIALYRTGDFENAIKAFDNAIAITQADGLLYNLRGCSKELIGDKSGAKKDYKTAKELGIEKVGLDENMKKISSQNETEETEAAEAAKETEKLVAIEESETKFVWVDKPITPREREILDEAIRDRLIKEMLASGDIYGAIALLEKRAETDFEHPENYLMLAKTKLNFDNYTGTISDAETAVLKGANPEEAYYLEGLAYKKRGNRIYAYRNLALAYSSDKQNSDYIYNLADAAYNIGRYKETYDLASTLLDNNLEERYPEVRLLVAKSEYRLNKYYAAVDDCNKYLKNNKKSADAYTYRAFSKEALERYDEAIDDYSKAIKYDRKNVDLHKYRGNLLLAQGRNSKAIRDFEKIVSLKGDKATRQDHLLVAELERNAGNYNNAIATYTQYIRKDKLNDVAYLSRARVYAQKGDKYNAIADYSTSLRLNPYQTTVYKERGILLVKIGSYRRGAEDISKALLIEPNNGQLYYYRALANKALGKKEEANSDYEKARSFEAL